MKTTKVKRALVLVLGRTPNVLTAALNYFTAFHRPRLTFDRIVVLTTGAGNEELRCRVLAPGRLRALAREYRQRTPRLETVVFRRRYRVLPDLQTPADFRAAQQSVFRVFRRLKQEGYEVHGVITGGRKTLSLLLVFAAMYHGDNDRLYQLILPPALEHGDFWFLTRRECRVQQLAALPIPFLRLSPLLRAARVVPSDDFLAMAERSQRAVDDCLRRRPSAVRFERRRRTLSVDGQAVPLAPKELIVCVFFLEAALAGGAGAFRGMKEIIFHRRLARLGEELFPGKRLKFDERLMREHVSRINRKLRAVAAGRSAVPPLIVARGDRWHKRYGMELPRDKIVIA